MKKYTALFLAFVLTAILFVGCGCTNTTTMETTTTPTSTPTTHATTEPTAEMTTMPTTMATEPSETIDHGNGPLPEASASTDATGENATRSRRNMPIE